MFMEIKPKIIDLQSLDFFIQMKKIVNWQTNTDINVFVLWHY